MAELPKDETSGSLAFFSTLSGEEVKEMKKAIYATVVVALLAFFAGSLAQDSPRIFSGRIQTIDGGSKTIAVRSGEKQMAFRISGDTAIKADHGEKLAFADLKVTMSVTVEYMKEGDDVHPLSVKVSTMPKGFGKAGQAQTFSGKIETVDVAGGTVTVTGKEGSMVFQTYGDTNIKSDSGDNVPLGELKKGMSVTVQYFSKGASIHPVSINVGTMPKGSGKTYTRGKK